MHYWELRILEKINAAERGEWTLSTEQRSGTRKSLRSVFFPHGETGKDLVTKVGDRLASKDASGSGESKTFSLIALRNQTCKGKEVASGRNSHMKWWRQQKLP